MDHALLSVVMANALELEPSSNNPNAAAQNVTVSLGARNATCILVARKRTLFGTLMHLAARRTAKTSSTPKRAPSLQLDVANVAHTLLGLTVDHV